LAGRATGRSPALAKRSEGPAGQLSPEPDEGLRDHAPLLHLEFLDLRPVRPERGGEVRRQERRPALAVLRLTGLEAQDAA